MTRFVSKVIAACFFACSLVGSVHAAPAAEAPKDPPAQKTGGPRLVIEQEVLDVGQVIRGQNATGTFILRNEGTDTLRVLSAKPG